MERFINILIIDSDPKVRMELKEILSGGGNNILLAKSIPEALPIIKQKEIGIYLINIEESQDGFINIHSIHKNSIFKNNYTIIISKDDLGNTACTWDEAGRSRLSDLSIQSKLGSV